MNNRIFKRELRSEDRLVSFVCETMATWARELCKVENYNSSLFFFVRELKGNTNLAGWSFL